MTVTECAILLFKSPPDFSDPTLRPLFQKLSTWQSECSGFPLLFFTGTDDPHQVHLVTGWTDVGAHEAWIRGTRNQELLRVFAPYVDIPKVWMVHLDVDFEAIQTRSRDAEGMVVEQYHRSGGDSDSDPERLKATAHCQTERLNRNRSTWSLTGRDLAADSGGDVYRFVGAAGSGSREIDSEVGGALPEAPMIERWALKRVEL